MRVKPSLAYLGIVGTALAYLGARATSYEPIISCHRVKTPLRSGKPDLRIAHISDFHAGSGIWSPEALNRHVRQGKPDFVCVTGDHFDQKYPSQEVERALLALAQELPVLYVTGNNEEEMPQINDILRRLRAGGLYVLENESASFFVKDGGITFYGVRDHKAYPGEDNWLATVQEGLVSERVREPVGYRVVLGHRPEILSLYDSLRQDLVLCGHAHGGQWRIGKRGVFAPNQGILPKYSRGFYRRGKEFPYNMIVSAGFDVHPVVPRIFNRPELVFVDIVGV